MNPETLSELVRRVIGYNEVGYWIIQIVSLPILTWAWWRFRTGFLFLFLVSHVAGMVYQTLWVWRGSPWETPAWVVGGESIYLAMLFLRMIALVWCLRWFWQTRESQHVAAT
jgi:hypothetical protein